MAGSRARSKDSTGQKIGRTKDYDPEDDLHVPSSSQDGSDSEADEDVGGREHYEKVAKSKLRQPDVPRLDESKYGGVVVSRHALDAEDGDDEDPFQLQDDEDDDPFAQNGEPEKGSNDELDETNKDGETLEQYMEIDEDDEIDSDEALGESDEELTKRFVFRGSKKNQIVQNGDEQVSGEGDEEFETDSAGDRLSDRDTDDDDEESEGVEEEDDEDDGEGEATTASRRQSRDPRRAALAQSLTASLAQSLSSNAAADATKGRAVRQQYKTFDRLLDARIKLQKSVAASEQLLVQETSSQETKRALERAEEAAIKLFNTIDALRQDMAEARLSVSQTTVSKKRKRLQPVEPSTSSIRAYQHLTETEDLFTASRRQIVDKWNQKIKLSDPSRIADNGRSKFSDASARSDRLTEILDTYITNETDKHLRTLENEPDTNDNEDQSRNHQHQDTTRPPPSVLSFNDNIFYQTLLRDLISTRSTTLASSTTSLPILPPSHKLHASGNTARSRKIDTKASKGRQIRYTVHEKMQNFMAAQGDAGRDTAMWTERGKDEFFGSLFGMSRALAEEEDRDVDGNGDKVDDDRETEALRLFRS